MVADADTMETPDDDADEDQNYEDDEYRPSDEEDAADVALLSLRRVFYTPGATSVVVGDRLILLRISSLVLFANRHACAR